MKNLINKLAKDESAQGATEYILLLVVVVAVVAMFRDEIQVQVKNLIGKLSGEIGKF